MSYLTPYNSSSTDEGLARGNLVIGRLQSRPLFATEFIRMGDVYELRRDKSMGAH